MPPKGPPQLPGDDNRHINPIDIAAALRHVEDREAVRSAVGRDDDDDDEVQSELDLAMEQIAVTFERGTGPEWDEVEHKPGSMVTLDSDLVGRAIATGVMDASTSPGKGKLFAGPREGLSYPVGPASDAHPKGKVPADGISWNEHDKLAVQHLANYRPWVLETPTQALDIHLDYWSWCRTPAHLDATEQFIQAYYRITQVDVPDALVEVFNASESQVVYDAQTHYVDPDVSEVVRQMGLAMPHDKLQAVDIQVPIGFAVLGKAWPYLKLSVDGVHGHIPVRAICWKVGQIAQPGSDDTKPGVHVYLYCDSESILWDRAEKRPPLYLVDMWGWTFDSWWQNALSDEIVDQHHVPKHIGEIRRELLAFWRFMADEIVYSGRTKMPRPAVRRWGRTSKQIPEDGSIVTVHLRRIKQSKTRFEKAGDDTEKVQIAWSHRWWVSGHHRFDAKTGAKTIWVRPYLKPKDDSLPIRIKEKIISVDR